METEAAQSVTHKESLQDCFTFRGEYDTNLEQQPEHFSTIYLAYWWDSSPISKYIVAYDRVNGAKTVKFAKSSLDNGEWYSC